MPLPSNVGSEARELAREPEDARRAGLDGPSRVVPLPAGGQAAPSPQSRDGLGSAMLEASPEAVALVGDAGRILAWSPAAAHLFGHARERALGATLAELIVAPASRDRCRAEIAAALADGGRTRRVELAGLRADGAEIRIELAARRVEDGQPRCVAYLRHRSDRASVGDLPEVSRQYRELVERLPVVTYLAEYGAAGRWFYVSPQIEALMGYPPQKWIDDNMLWDRSLHPDDIDRVYVAEERCAREGLGLDIEYRMQTRDGRWIWVRDEAAVGGRDDSELVRVEGVLTDITDRKLAEQRLRHRADHDDLTGLYNRRRFEEEVARYPRSDRHTGAVAILDVDHLKFVNDALGHAAGDSLLRGLAGDLREALGPREIAARLGGDEFAVLLPAVDEDSARRRAAEMVRALRSHDGAMPRSVSAGVVAFGERGPATSEDLLVAADIALHEAKADGGNRATLYTGRQGERLAWLGKLRDALEHERLVLHAQPIVELASGDTVAEELLVRLLDRDGELLSPATFLPTAERFGLVADIDRWVIGRAAELAAGGRRVTVNLSARTLADPELIDLVEGTCADAGVDPSALIFEITETATATAIDDIREFASRIDRLGCALAIDDFGTGFGSLTYLKHLPVRLLKIDMEFVQGMHESAADLRIVRAITSIAGGLGVRTVAEGVEDEGTLEMLRGIGVDYAQGYHLGRPAPV